jgi:hypothetical protein
MPFQIANVRRSTADRSASFDLILKDENGEITFEGCALEANLSQPNKISLQGAKLNGDAAKAVALRVIVSLSR